MRPTPCSNANTDRPTWFQTASKLLYSLAALALAFAIAAHQYLSRHPLPVPAVVAIYLCFVLLLAGALVPATFGGSLPLSPKHFALFHLFWVAAYLIYVAGTHDFRVSALLKLAGIPLLLSVLYRAFPVRTLEQFTWQDFAASLGLIATVLFHGLSGIFTVPINLDFMARLSLIGVAAWLWVFVRPVPNLGYTLAFSPKILRAAGLNFLYFAAIALPLGFLLGFIRWNPHWRGFGAFGLVFLEIFLLIAVLEELFFRGFLQTLISRSLHSDGKAHLLVSLLFGLFHILHAPFPNWRYVVLASIAGWFYGEAFRQGGSLVASSLTHALVDTAWRTWFSASV